MLGYNTLIGQLRDSYNFTCQTQCEKCYTPSDNSSVTSKLCGLFNTDESSAIQYRMGNFTLEDLTSGNKSESDFRALIFGQYSGEECIQYTSDEYDNIELCLAITTDISSNSEDSLYCNITYNNVLCSSCSIANADCTNVDATYGTMIDECNNVSANGPFQISPYWTMSTIIQH